MFYIDPFYLILVLPAFLFAVIMNIRVNVVFNRYNKVLSPNGLTGADVAKMILEINGIGDVKVVPVKGNLTDNYDPRNRVLSLSEKVYGSASIGAIGVAAHECGHAIQHSVGYAPIGIRSALVPVAGIGSQFGPYMAIFGIIFSIPLLINIGIVLYAVAVLFYLVTLPVEINASTRAIGTIESMQILGPEETKGAKKVLRAAAMTYIAAAAVAMLSLLRLILLSNSRSRN